MEQIKIKDLTFFYNKQEKPAIENLSFNIEKGDFVVLCGKSGCGKRLRYAKSRTSDSNGQSLARIGFWFGEPWVFHRRNTVKSNGNG